MCAYSDACGGQNRNYKMALIWLYMCQKFNFDEANHKFLISGHSYLPNDADFGVIERTLPKSTEIYTVQQWINHIETCCTKNPYSVNKMAGDNSYPVSNLLKNVTVRKISEQGEKVKWLSIQWLQVRKAEPFKLFYKYSVENDVEFKYVNLAKSFKVTNIVVPLEPLYTAPRAIS